MPELRLDDPRAPHSVALLKRHLEFTASVPPGIRYALDVDGLAVPSIRFWTAWEGDKAIGCAALKALDATHAELKSMHVIAERRGGQAADTILRHLIAEARASGVERISLETGSSEGYIPARRFYARHGFVNSPPFADYEVDPLSTYMSLALCHENDGLTFRLDDPTDAHSLGLLEAHLAFSYASSPPETVFALDPEELNTPDIQFWTVWLDGACVGCGALRRLTAEQFELKSMHTAVEARGRGLGRALMDFLIERVQERGGVQLLLETGSMASYEPARRLYQRHGFVERGPFGAYPDDPHSIFMQLDLA